MVNLQLDNLRPVTIIFKDGITLDGFFHKFTQGNMANDAVIVEDFYGKVFIFDLHKDNVDFIKFRDR